MESYNLILFILGVIGFLIAWLTIELEDRVISFPMVMVILGTFFYSLPFGLPNPDPNIQNNLILHLSELAVILSLMGTGLKINTPFTMSNYRVPFMMILITMIGCIATVALTGWLAAGFLPASALLLGAAFAPTDPVIADTVQVGYKEDEKEEHPVTFSLTAEAGLNDGMAFPFTWFAVLAASYGLEESGWLVDWVLFDLFYRIIIGAIIGFVLGRILAYLLFTLPERYGLPLVRREFLAIACTFLVYSIVEGIHGYGFIAVFVTGLTLHHYEKEHDFQKTMHDFIEQIEKVLLAIVLFLLGGYAVTQMFTYLHWEAVLLVLVFVFVIRPIFGRLALFNTEMSRKEKWLVSFMGMKGVGSFFYLAFGLSEANFANNEQLWAVTGFLVLVSVVIHGISLYFLKPLFNR